MPNTEDYTYHLEPGNETVLGSHMLEICLSTAATCPRIEVHPLGSGGKADPARLVFDEASGPAVNASLVDLGSRFRIADQRCVFGCLPGGAIEAA